MRTVLHSKIQTTMCEIENIGTVLLHRRKHHTLVAQSIGEKGIGHQPIRRLDESAIGK